MQIEIKELDERIRNSPTLVLSLFSGTDFAQLEGQYPNISFITVDPPTERILAAQFGLQPGPALLIFRDGVGLYRENGDYGTEHIGRLIDRVCALDMVQVRASIERERSEVAVNMQRMCPAARRGPLL